MIVLCATAARISHCSLHTLICNSQWTLPLTLCGEIRNKSVHRTVNCTQCENVQRLSTNFVITGRRLQEGGRLWRDRSSLLRGRGGSSKFVLFTIQDDTRWSRRTVQCRLFLTCAPVGTGWSDGGWLPRTGRGISCLEVGLATQTVWTVC
jgi:hypothetical protein